LTLALVNLCKSDFDVTNRWQLFLVYVAVAGICWLLNLVGLKGIPTLEVIGCWATILGFVAFTVALLVRAPKASAHDVFVKTNNNTGYVGISTASCSGVSWAELNITQILLNSIRNPTWSFQQLFNFNGP
jgi:choline transport protein